MEGTLLCLDVGGTELKGAAMRGGAPLAPLRHFPARAGEGRGELLGHFAQVLGELDAGAGVPADLAGVRLAFPGPFDYDRGICLLQGLDKYDALYGVDLRRELYARLQSRVAGPGDIRFANDVAAVALGEMAFGGAAGAARSLTVCIGTGCGSAFGLGQGLAPEGTPGVPPNGYIYSAPFLDGCIDDYISKRGLMSLCREQLGEALDGAALAGRCAAGDGRAAACFTAFGLRLRDALAPFLLGYRPQCLCLGGQITRSFQWFGPPLETFCESLGIALHITADTSLRALQGLCGV